MERFGQDKKSRVERFIDLHNVLAMRGRSVCARFASYHSRPPSSTSLRHRYMLLLRTSNPASRLGARNRSTQVYQRMQIIEHLTFSGLDKKLRSLRKCHRRASAAMLLISDVAQFTLNDMQSSVDIQMIQPLELLAYALEAFRSVQERPFRW